MAEVKVLPFKSHKVTRTRTETLLVTLEGVEKWQNPPFQRELRENDRVRQLAEAIREDGVIPGVVTLGKIGRSVYVLDGQHRIHAFKLSGLDQIYADVRTHEFKDVAEMGEEFVSLNSHLVPLRPDDVLRGLEEMLPSLQRIRKACPFVGYGYVRGKANNAPLLSMSALLRTWFCSNSETPLQSPQGGGSAQQLAARLTDDDVTQLLACLKVLKASWGADREHMRLWSGLNLTLCVWLWNQCVVAGESANRKAARLTPELFGKAMMSVAAESGYYDWLMGRKMGERDRAPAYSRLRAIVARRVAAETGAEKPKLPAPAWYTRK